MANGLVFGSHRGSHIGFGIASSRPLVLNLPQAATGPSAKVSVNLTGGLLLLSDQLLYDCHKAGHLRFNDAASEPHRGRPHSN